VGHLTTLYQFKWSIQDPRKFSQIKQEAIMVFRWNNKTDDVLAEFPDKYVSKARHVCYRCDKLLCVTTLVA
jgi:hypothetical protein